MRVHAKETGLPTFYDRRWRDASPAVAPPHGKPVIRIKAPLLKDQTNRTHSVIE